MKKLIFICTGNTCRSPMAEITFKKYLIDNNINNVEVSSAGISACTGDTAAENAVLTVSELGLDLKEHRARQLSVYDFSDNTYFVCMTLSHKAVLQNYISENRIFVLDVPDPFGGSLLMYNECLEMITKCFDRVINWLENQIEIRRMEEKDIEKIFEIETECFSVPWSEKSIMDELTNKTARFFVASKNLDVIGYIGANNIVGEVYITNVAVKKNFRRQGIAKELIKELISVSENEKANFVTLEVRESNEAAIALYEKVGFEKVGARKDFYAKPLENAIIMTNFYK